MADSSTWERIFATDALREIHGEPNAITPEGCLALARLEHEAWNAWRKEYPVITSKENPLGANRANFSYVDFTSESIDFSFFNFGDRANFDSATFGNGANFYRAKFGDYASFNGTKFVKNTIFKDAEFGSMVNFIGANFGADVYFHKAKFASAVYFEYTSFVGRAIFYEAKFGFGSSFNNANFFYACFNQSIFEVIEFNNSCFEEAASFNDAKFTDRTRFVDVIFKKAPTFHSATLHPDISFKNATFPPETGDTDAENAYRTLKLSFNSMHHLDEEARFFKLELSEKAVHWPRHNRILFCLYDRVAECGYSWARPLTVLGIFVLFFSNFYIFACADFDKPNISSSTIIDYLLFSAAQTVPRRFKNEVQHCDKR